MCAGKVQTATIAMHITAAVNSSNKYNQTKNTLRAGCGFGNRIGSGKVYRELFQVECCERSSVPVNMYRSFCNEVPEISSGPDCRAWRQ